PVEVDSKPFSIAWTRGTTATGSTAPGERIAFGSRVVVVDRVDLRTDRVEVVWRTEDWTGADPTLSVAADGAQLDPVPVKATQSDQAAGRRRSAWYPAPRGTRALTIQVSTPSGARRLVVPIA